MKPSWVTGAGVPASRLAPADPDKIVLMRQTLITVSNEIVIWMIWMKTSGWWKNSSFLLLPLPSLLAGTPTSERTVTRAIWRVPRSLLRPPFIPTATSPPRILSTLRSCSSCSNNKLRILSQPHLQSSVSSGSQPNNLHLLNHPSFTIIPISSLVPMTSTSTDAVINGRP